ncbi:hypothetical protein AKJ09_02029 [Labilithrix luteola]|uniref:Uncharacterized protein n=2 Tax=Labilithrix luteola TaxID=1391654 RepID=A0A0K1PP97_9BACT|nr:hypothetical protein AKJ09_02029 [Labilithrix luteola]
MPLGDKASRVLKLMMGMRSPRIASAMAAYGFKDSDLQEGWALLHAVGRVKLDANGIPTTDTNTLAELDAWENRWFPIASATLERRFPAVHAQIFKNLSQTEGPAVAVSVRTFLERFDQMAQGTGSYGAEGKQARDLLVSRGLTESVLNDARTLLENVGKIAVSKEPVAPQDPKIAEKAENDLWAWYLEWSQIARIAVTQRALLKQLGFMASRSKSHAADDGEETDDEVPVPPGGTAKPTVPAAPNV